MDHLLTNKVTISRSSLTENTYKTTYSEVGTIACQIQPLAYGFGIGQMGRDGKDYRMFSTAEVRIGDRLEDENGKKYEVTGAQLLTWRSRQHYQSELRST